MVHIQSTVPNLHVMKWERGWEVVAIITWPNWGNKRCSNGLNWDCIFIRQWYVIWVLSKDLLNPPISWADWVLTTLFVVNKTISHEWMFLHLQKGTILRKNKIVTEKHEAGVGVRLKDWVNTWGYSGCLAVVDGTCMGRMWPNERSRIERWPGFFFVQFLYSFSWTVYAGLTPRKCNNSANSC